MAEAEYPHVDGDAVIVLVKVVHFVVVKGRFGEEQIYVLITFIGQVNSTE